MTDDASPTDPRMEATVLRDAADQLERVNAHVPGDDSQGIDYAVEYLRDLADRKAAAAADAAADTVPDPRHEPPGFKIVGWWCPRGGGHLETLPEKTSAVPLLVPEDDHAEVYAWWLQEHGDD